ncbi:NACHT domain-containing protein [Corynascus similis CBS 632.67]
MGEREDSLTGFVTGSNFERIQGHNFIADQNISGGTVTNYFYGDEKDRKYLQRSTRLLWIKGDPGKGKTMLLCGIIDELESDADSSLLSFFFCQATDASINNAVAVLRGLTYLLVDQQPCLISHVQKMYDPAGNPTFRDVNAWVALSEVSADIFKDPGLPHTRLIIDALDECIEGLELLLDLVVYTSSVYSGVKWIVSSRNWPIIEKKLDATMQNIRFSLELNEESVSTAVNTYIRNKVDWLAKQNRYNFDIRDAVERYLSANAHGTFLWVALVCQELAKTPAWKARRKLAMFSPGLDELYRRMMDQILSLEDTEDSALCKDILATMSAVYRPITLDELGAIVDAIEGIPSDDEAIAEIYSCVSWVSHLRDCGPKKNANKYLQDGGPIDVFIREKYLHWLEALSLLRCQLRR